MKAIALIALIGMTQAVKLEHKFLVPDMSPFNVYSQSVADLQSYGIDVKDFQQPNQHRAAWPVGVVDDSTNDHKVLVNDGKVEAKKAAAKKEV